MSRALPLPTHTHTRSMSRSVQVVNAAVFLGCFLLFVAYWAWTVYKALQDHERLPWAKYR